MRKQELDYLLEAAVAKALGVSMPANRKRPARARRKAPEPAHRVRRAA